MDKAKAAVSDFVGRHGKHDTTVDERQAPAVKHEEVVPTRHENITTAIDREVDQDHYHTTVQPVKDREILPEKHSHQMAGVQHKEFEHGNAHDTRARLDREAQQFKDTSTTHSTKHTQAVAPTVEAERVHHHVHETVQPVIEKETIAPSVVHTTVPIHESHHAAPEHHGTSVLPTKTMVDFKGTGQNLTGSSGIVNQDQYEGCPRPYNSEMQVGRTDADSNPHVHTSGFGSTNAGPHSSNMMNKADPRVDSDRDGHRGTIGGMTGSHTTSGPHSSDMANRADPRVDSDRDGRGLGTGAGMTGSGAGMTGTRGSHTTAGPHGSDMMNKADPRVDSDRDGSNRGMGTGMTGTSTGNKLDPRVDSHHTGESSGILSDEHLGGTGAPGSHSAVFGLTPKDTRGTDTSPIGGAPHTGYNERIGGGTDSTPIPGGHTSAHGTGVSDHAGHKKPSLMDRLNPMKDTDGDGKKGFMK